MSATAATSSVTPDAIVTEIHIEAPPARVFQALIDPAQVPQWWGQSEIYQCTEFQADLRVGGKWRAAGTAGNDGRFEVFGEFVEVNPPLLLAYTWTASWTGDTRTAVRWELEPEGRGTRVRIIHSGFAGRPELAQSYRGWPRMLEWLRVYLEGSGAGAR